MSAKSVKTPMDSDATKVQKADEVRKMKLLNNLIGEIEENTKNPSRSVTKEENKLRSIMRELLGRKVTQEEVSAVRGVWKEPVGI